MAIFLVEVKSCLTGARLFVTFGGNNAPLLRLFCQKLIRTQEEEEQAYRGKSQNVQYQHWRWPPHILNSLRGGNLLQVTWRVDWNYWKLTLATVNRELPWTKRWYGTRLVRTAFRLESQNSNFINRIETLTLTLKSWLHSQHCSCGSNPLPYKGLNCQKMCIRYEYKL